jgi:hypothetical protein
MSDFFRASAMIDCSVLDAFNYVANPTYLPEWVPFYNDVSPQFDRTLEKGDRFVATLSMVPPVWNRFAGLPGIPTLFSSLLSTSWPIQVDVDDVVHGRRIAYRAKEVSWTTICDFEPMAGQTILTVTHSLWSMSGLMANQWLGPVQGTIGDLHRRVIDGLKRRLEGRQAEIEPKIFFSYRRADAPYVAGRIFDALTSEFGLGTVFRDADSLVGGRNWARDVTKVISECRVIVAHVADNWESELVKRADEDQADGLRDELEAGLKNPNAILIPVITSAQSSVTAHERLVAIGAVLSAGQVAAKAPRICERFTPALQSHRLRPDPDFRSDLERLMRSVWFAFHENRASASARR